MDTKAVTTPWVPPEVVAGSTQIVPGERPEDIIWQVASVACDAERIRIVWSEWNGRWWWLATPASAFNDPRRAGSVCPLAAHLPGMNGVSCPHIAVYTNEDIATLLVAVDDDLRVERNSASLIRSRARRLAAAEETEIVDISDSEADAAPPWFAVGISDDHTRRTVTTWAVLSGLAVAGLATLVWFSAVVGTFAIRSEVADARAAGEAAARQMLNDARTLSRSPLQVSLSRLTDVDARLLAIGGHLQRYEVKDGNPVWSAVIPPTVAASQFSDLNVVAKEMTDSGLVVIGGTKR